MIRCTQRKPQCWASYRDDEIRYILVLRRRMGPRKRGRITGEFHRRYPLPARSTDALRHQYYKWKRLRVEEGAGTQEQDSHDHYGGQEGGRTDGISGDGNEGGRSSIVGKGEDEFGQGGNCYEATNKAGYECVDRYGDTRVYEREDDVGDGKPVALGQGNIGIDSYGDDDHRWGRDGDSGIEDKDKDSDEDDGDNDDDGEDEDDDEEDEDDDEEDEDDDEEDEDDDGDEEDDYQGAGERMDKDRAGQGYHDGYQN
ncbi:hypothetical protein C7212DRAFT_362860 [Tuber magnatum]|uniref:Myb-like domain-containing protein n=1 Tax=Tuber magnatum TaxID=42249 RepID=A0A317SUD2_9PEZI|nr:hypothetical protein C7212DRAFT_362860 [Tuber magnatum]